MPLNTRHSCVPALNTIDIKSLFKISFLVSQPFLFTSDQVCPNCEREYPVFGARPLTAIWSMATKIEDWPGEIDVADGDILSAESVEKISTTGVIRAKARTTRLPITGLIVAFYAWQSNLPLADRV